jgi:hypothetical protein
VPELRVYGLSLLQMEKVIRFLTEEVISKSVVDGNWSRYDDTIIFKFDTLIFKVGYVFYEGDFGDWRQYELYVYHRAGFEVVSAFSSPWDVPIPALGNLWKELDGKYPQKDTPVTAPFGREWAEESFRQFVEGLK